MACTDVQTIQAGNGTTTQFSFDFPYIFKSEIHVYFWNAVTKEYDEKLTTDATYPWQITDANPTIVEFTGTAPPSPATPVDPGESTVDNVKIRRITKVDDIRALFNPGSAIRSDDLNKNFEQLRYAIQEANCAGIPDDVDQYLKDYYWDRYDNTLYDGDTWVSDDTKIATTAALDARFQDEVNDTFTKAELAAASNIMPDDDVAVPTTGALNDYINEVITNDIGTDGTGITVTDDGDGTITLGLADNTIDFSKIKNDDIITYAEQPTVTTSDNNIFTASAAERQFDTIVQVATPSGSDWEVGKTWLQNDVDKTLSIWNGSAWVAVASGGSFTELTKVIYVDAVNGDDALAGHRISNPKKTIKAAIDDINADADGDGSIVLVAPGIYGETFPISIQKNDVAIVGQSLRNCIVHPAIPAADQAGYDVDVPETNELATMFEVNSGTYIYGLTLTGMKASGTRGGNTLDTDATYGLPTNQGWNFAFRSGATIKKSPYIQNCTNFSDSQINNVTFTPHTPGEGAAGDLDSGPSGGGILINGATVDSNSPLRSMVCDSYTHTALDGPGIFVTNNGYCQATSSYSFFNHFHLKTKNGGQANLAASTTDFGSHSLIADGRSPYAIFTATTTAIASDGSATFTIGAPTARTATPLPWHGNATRPQDNMLVDIGGNTYPILSAVAAGSGWTVTISRPDPNDRNSNLGLDGAVSSGSAVSFFLRSMIASSGHTMEYVGSGTDYTALPENGGEPDDTKQLTELNNGKIWAAITDHRGTFKVGDTFEVNQQTGFVSIDPTASNSVTKTGVNGNAIIPAGTTAQRSTPANGHFRYNTTDNKFEGYVNGAWSKISDLISDITPQLGGDLDVNGQSIVSASNGNITLDPDGTGGIILDSNVGIGTSSPNNYSNFTTLTLNGTTGGVIDFENNGTLAGELYSDVSSIRLVASTSKDLRFATNGNNERMRIDTSGNVGIGTTSPGRTLEVSNSATQEGIRVRTTTTTVGDESRIEFAQNGQGSGNNVVGVIRGISAAGSGGDLAFNTTSSGAGSEAMRIDKSKRVGIGTTSPTQKLHVVGNQTRAFIDSTSSSSTVGIVFGDNGTNVGGVLYSNSDDAMLFNTNGTTERLRIDSSGDVKIGGTLPSAPNISLNANGTASFAGDLSLNGTDATINIGPPINRSTIQHKTSTGYLNINARANYGIIFSAGSTERMVLNNVGNLNIGGIPSTSPNISLNANGTASFAGDALINGLSVGRGAGNVSTNTAVGNSALANNTTGSNNIANGYQALFANTTGAQNTANGRQALKNNTTGSGNIGIGFVNNTGNYAPVFDPTTENNRLVLGNTSITNAYVQVAWTVTSDERDKMNFAPVPYGLDFVNQLKPTAYQFKVDRDTETPNGNVRYGFKAQDILALEGDNPVIIDTEDADNLKYKGEHLVPVLVNAVQELTAMVKELQTEIKTLKG